MKTVKHKDPLPPLARDAAQRQLFSLTVTAPCRDLRLDRFLAEHLKGEGFSRERVKAFIREGRVTVDGEAQRSPKTRLRERSEISLEAVLPPSSLTPETGELEIIYRDAVLAVINKPAGLTTHPAPGLDSGTLAHRLLAHFPELAGQPGERPGIVHRLDKDTSGLMLVALSEECRLALSGMFARHDIHKEYLALVKGVPNKPEGVIDAPVGRHPTYKTRMAVVPGGKKAGSAWRVLYADPDGGFALVAVRIFSGRTHQVRVHMAHIGHPLLGDAVYGGASAAGADMPERQMLHAWKLAFAHPLPDKAGSSPVAALPQRIRRDKDTLSFCCPPPRDIAEASRLLSRRCLRVVITGSPGCGKSALLARIGESGVPVFSADACVNALYAHGGDGRHLLAARYGERFVPDPGGPVDKVALGTAMRENDALRREVEAMLHPLVFAALRDFWREHADAKMAVAEIPLYLECGRNHQTAEHERPVLVGVRCPLAIRKNRLKKRRGWNRETIARMESWQWPEERKLAACDMIADNSGTLEQLDAEAEKILRALDALRLNREKEALASIASRWRCPDG